MSFLGLIFALACLPAALLDFAAPIWKADNNTQIEDAYKWLHQATRGGEHAAPSKTAAEQWLKEEIATLEVSSNQAMLWQPLCKDETIGRLDIRAFIKQGGQQGDLADAFILSAVEYQSDGTEFIAAWNELGNRLKKHKIGNLRYADWLKLDEKAKEKNYPAMHHSEKYTKANLPAYRVLTKKQYENLAAKLRR